MTVQSYNGNLDFGFIADRDLVPDLWRMVDLLHESVAELLGCCEPVRPAKKRRASRSSAAARG
jgi:hypothetical protein